MGVFTWLGQIMGMDTRSFYSAEASMEGPPGASLSE